VLRDEEQPVARVTGASPGESALPVLFLTPSQSWALVVRVVIVVPAVVRFSAGIEYSVRLRNAANDNADTNYATGSVVYGNGLSRARVAAR
jgi:hypothetical protein